MKTIRKLACEEFLAAKYAMCIALKPSKGFCMFLFIFNGTLLFLLLIPRDRIRRPLSIPSQMPEYVLSFVSGYQPDVYFCSVRESSGSRLFFIIFRRLTIGSHVVHCPACHAVINYVPFKEHRLLFILHFCRIFAATFAHSVCSLYQDFIRRLLGYYQVINRLLLR